MLPVVQEWLNLLVRWAHVIAGIMWIGDSFFFMWLDSHLSKPSKPREGEVVGELWMTHSGGFYEVVKKKSLLPSEMPPTLFWFKWESYSTWITGFLLLLVVYGLGGRAMLVEAESPLGHAEALAISLGLLVAGVLVYDALCRTPLIQNTKAFGVIGLICTVAAAYGIGQIFSARATFLQIGAMIGTIMASNVFLRIIPAQKHMIAATQAGLPVDTSYGMRAKQRSVHNHYVTLPVLFTMISNHFPGLYGHQMPWLVLGLLFVLGAGIKYTMSFRGNTHPIVLAGTLAAFVATAVLTRPAAAAVPVDDGAPKVSYAEVRAILDARCTTCHAAKPTSPAFPSPPVGVVLESPAQAKAWSERMWVRAVQTKTMPLANLTGMTDDERAKLGAWIAQGAQIP